MAKKTNIKTIAAALQVSPSTVSKALKDSHEISAKTKERIKAYAKKHNYRPNRLAMSLRNKKTNVIGIIIPEIVPHFFSRVLYGIETFAYANNYSLMICLSKDTIKKEIQNIDMLTNGNVDGLLISVAKETLEKENYNHFIELIDDDFPIVFLENVPQNLKIDKVISNDIKGGYLAAKHLIGVGCKKIAIVSNAATMYVEQAKETGFFKALKEFNIPIKPNYHLKVKEVYKEKEKEYIEKQIEVIFNQKEMPDGIFATNEIYAAIALKIAHKKNLNVPKDIAIIGFTDGIISKTANPSLTTIAQHGYTMGTKAMEILLDRIHNKNKVSSYKTHVIATNVVKRKST